MDDLKVQLVDDVSLPPMRGRFGDAGYDLFSRVDITIPAHSHCLVPLGVKTEFNPDLVAILHDRSSMGLKGIHVFGGVIDSGYRGEWAVILYNSTTEPYKVEKGNKIVQTVFHKYETPHVQLVESVNRSARNESGFGSSGV